MKHAPDDANLFLIGSGLDAVVFDAAKAIIFGSNSDSGTIAAVHQDDADHFRVSATIPTRSARTLALDPRLHGLYLCAARLGTTRQTNGRPKVEPDSFSILTVGQL